MTKKQELIEFKKAMTEKYGTTDFNNKLTETEFWKYMRLKGKKFSRPHYQKNGHKNPAVSYRNSGVH